MVEAYKEAMHLDTTVSKTWWRCPGTSFWLLANTVLVCWASWRLADCRREIRAV